MKKKKKTGFVLNNPPLLEDRAPLIPASNSKLIAESQRMIRKNVRRER